MIHLTVTKTLEDHRNVSDVLSKLLDAEQKKLDVIFKDVCVQRSFSVLLCQLTYNKQAAVSVESRALKEMTSLIAVTLYCTIRISDGL